MDMRWARHVVVRGEPWSGSRGLVPATVLEPTLGRAEARACQMCCLSGRALPVIRAVNTSHTLATLGRR